MALLPILTAPDPRLKKRAKPVEKVDDGVRRLMADMLETMYAAPGIGLAAPQVGVGKRVLVLDVAREGEPTNPMQLGNPAIVWVSDDDNTCEEGCLSVPEHYAEVARPRAVKVRYLDETGAERLVEAEGRLAPCPQPALDHRAGPLFIPH